MSEAKYWFRLEDDETFLMSLPPAQLKCLLVVRRSCQRDKNAGHLSARQVAKRAGLSPYRAHEALAKLARTGCIEPRIARGKTTVYAQPFNWREGNDRTPTGEHPNGQVPREREQQCAPTSEQHCTRRGVQTLELSDYSEASSSFSSDREKPKPSGTPEWFGEAEQLLRTELPDIKGKLTSELLCCFRDIPDVRSFLSVKADRIRKMKWWGGVREIAKDWQAERPKVKSTCSCGGGGLQWFADATCEDPVTSARPCLGCDQGKGWCKYYDLPEGDQELRWALSDRGMLDRPVRPVSDKNYLQYSGVQKLRRGY